MEIYHPQLNHRDRRTQRFLTAFKNEILDQREIYKDREGYKRERERENERKNVELKKREEEREREGGAWPDCMKRNDIFLFI